MVKPRIEDKLIKHDEELVALDLKSGQVPPSILYQNVVEWVHKACALALDAEKEGMSKQEIRGFFHNARSIHGRSEWIKRLQTWPRGYPGDFETIEMLMQGVAAPDLSTVAGCCEFYALNCPASQQHRNKIQIQSDLIRRSIDKGNIFSIACGGCIDIENALQGYRGANGASGGVFINDLDRDAIEFATGRLESAEIHHQVIEGNIIRALSNRALENISLIIAGGLFDYLNDKNIGKIIHKGFHDILQRGGNFVFTNINKMNPYRPWIEYLANWELIERSADEIEAIVKSGNIPDDAISYKTDPTGMALVFTLTKA
ncbi:MAG: hypothetical protein AAF441_10140 [Pseudomonadota bacterium]